MDATAEANECCTQEDIQEAVSARGWRVTKSNGPTENTVPKQLTPWKPGESGNPRGRPRGARSKLGAAFIEALAADFETQAWRRSSG